MSELERGIITSVRAVIVQESHLLILRRSPTAKRNPGQWELPGGQVTDLGESLEDGLLRETEQETGHIIRLTSGLSMIERRVIRDAVFEAGSLAVSYAANARIIGGNFSLSTEHVDSNWMPLYEPHTFEITPPTAVAISMENHPSRMQQPSFSAVLEVS